MSEKKNDYRSTLNLPEIVQHGVNGFVCGSVEEMVTVIHVRRQAEAMIAAIAGASSKRNSAIA